MFSKIIKASQSRYELANILTSEEFPRDQEGEIVALGLGPGHSLFWPKGGEYMSIPDIFQRGGVDELTRRIDALEPDTRPQWGKMYAAQMLAHNSLVFEGVRKEDYPKMNPIMRWMISRMIRGMVVGDKPYKRNSRTAPDWVVSDPHDFEQEKARILENIQAIHQLGASKFEGKKNPTFGTLNSQEWSRLFCKHLDYHLEQFGA
jgi:hypothetical protein